MDVVGWVNYGAARAVCIHDNRIFVAHARFLEDESLQSVTLPLLRREWDDTLRSMEPASKVHSSSLRVQRPEWSLGPVPAQVKLRSSLAWLAGILERSAGGQSAATLLLRAPFAVSRRVLANMRTCIPTLFLFATVAWNSMAVASST